MLNKSETIVKGNEERESFSTNLPSFAEYTLLNEIKQLSTTKKSLWSLESKKYTFLVSPWVSKPFIKLAVEKYFNVRVLKINTSNLPVKKKYVGKYVGVKSRLKKAIITLDPGDEITLFSDI